MFLSASMLRRLLTALAPVLASTIMLASASHAQTAVSAATAAPEVSTSAIKGYKPYTDEPVVNWKTANETTAHIGGWREYARQAQQPDNTPVPAAHAGRPAAETLKKAAP